MTDETFAGFRLRARRPAATTDVQHWSALGVSGDAEVFVGGDELAQRAASLPVWGPFPELIAGTRDGRRFVVVRGSIDKDVEDLKDILSPGACVAFAWHVAAVIAAIHERGGAHGALHPSYVGLDHEGRLTVRPALAQSLTAEPDPGASAMATDCLQLGEIFDALDLERVDEPGLPLVLSGLRRDQARLRIQPGRGVRQALRAVLARHPDWVAALVETLGPDWSLDAMPQPPLEPLMSRDRREGASMLTAARLSVGLGPQTVTARTAPARVSLPSTAATAPAAPAAQRLQVTLVPHDPRGSTAPPSDDRGAQAAAAVGVPDPEEHTVLHVPPEEVRTSGRRLGATVEASVLEDDEEVHTPALGGAEDASGDGEPTLVQDDDLEDVVVNAPPVVTASFGPAPAPSALVVAVVSATEPVEPDSDGLPPIGPAEGTSPVEPTEDSADDAPAASFSVSVESPPADPGAAPSSADSSPDRFSTPSEDELPFEQDDEATMLGGGEPADPSDRPYRLVGAPELRSVSDAPADGLPAPVAEPLSGEPPSGETQDPESPAPAAPVPEVQAPVAPAPEARAPEPPPAAPPVSPSPAPAPRPAPPRPSAPVHPDDDGDGAPLWNSAGGVTGSSSREDELGSGKWQEDARSLDDVRKIMDTSPVREMEAIDDSPARGAWPALAAAAFIVFMLVLAWVVFGGGTP